MNHAPSLDQAPPDWQGWKRTAQEHADDVNEWKKGCTDAYLDTKDAAKLFGIAKARIRSAIQYGKLKHAMRPWGSRSVYVTTKQWMYDWLASCAYRSPHMYLEEDRGYKTPCWIWQRSKNRNGYGLGFVPDDTRPTGWRTRLAHRIYWEAEYGPVPTGLELDHLCRQRACVRPDHQEAVTPAENSRRSSTTKLTKAIVADIRTSELSGRLLAKKYGISPTTVSNVIRYRRWRDV